MDNTIKILGAYGAKTVDTAMTCIQVDDEILIDAGNIMHSLEDSAKNINHIFLSHTHLDHIVDIPFLMDIFFDSRTEPLVVYGLEGAIENLKKYIFNWEVWPDFSTIDLPDSKQASMVFKVIELNEEITINESTLKPIKTEHTDSSCGYVITKGNSSILFTSDTFKCQNIWDELNSNLSIKSVIIDISFPSALRQLAIDSKHYTPEFLNEDLKNLHRTDIKIYINHLKPIFIEEIKDEIATKYPNLLNGGQILVDGDTLNLENSTIKAFPTREEVHRQNMEMLIGIGHSLTSEKDFDTLMEKILLGAKQLSNADGGTLYMLSDDEKSLSFNVVQTDSLEIKMGGTSGQITWPPVQLFNEDGAQNWEQVAALCAITGKLINVPDVYEAEGFNFEGTKKFDKGTGYRTTSMLVVPMKNHENDIIGVLQLLNKQDAYGKIIQFNKEDEDLIESMSSQAAVSITNTRLIKGLEKLLLDFIKSTADAISEKSKYTGGHINRVAEIASLIAREVNNSKEGIYKDKTFTDDELKQIDIAAWMHDIGKITTPEYVVDKATKLETIYDRIHTVIAKFEILKRDKEIIYLKACLNTKNEYEKNKLKEIYDDEILKIEKDLEIVKRSNKGSEFMPDVDSVKIKELANHPLTIDNIKTSLLTENELYNLSIKKGTLNIEERQTINNHVIVSYKMLDKLTFPKKLARVPLIAGSHHKTIYTDQNGKHGGYGAPEIMYEPMSIEDRILAVADVFEAVTASDRPYKDPNSLNQSLNILNFMVKNEELDRDLVKFFIDNKIYEKYTKDNLKPEQIDEVTVKID